MDISENVTATLRAQDHGHPPVILIEMTSTKNTVVFNEVCPTLTQRMGTGGGTK